MATVKTSRSHSTQLDNETFGIHDTDPSTQGGPPGEMAAGWLFIATLSGLGLGIVVFMLFP